MLATTGHEAADDERETSRVPSGRLTTETERFCDALTRVVDERGWSGATPGSIAREAGLTTNEFYDRFRSLEHCYVEVYDGMIGRLGQLVEQALATRAATPGERCWEDELEVVLGTVLWFFALEPALARTCVVEFASAGDAARRRRDDALSQFIAYVESLRLAHGEPMPAVAAEVIALGTAELIQTRVARGEAESLPELLPELRRLWCATVDDHSSAAATPNGALALSR